MDIHQLKQARLAFLGAGNMAEARIRGVLTGKLVDAGQVVASDPDAARRAHVGTSFGVAVICKVNPALKV